MPNSAIYIGSYDEDSFDLEGPLVIRECLDDEEYPIALEGTTVGGHDVSISLSQADVARLALHFSL